MYLIFGPPCRGSLIDNKAAPFKLTASSDMTQFAGQLHSSSLSHQCIYVFFSWSLVQQSCDNKITILLVLYRSVTHYMIIGRVQNIGNITKIFESHCDRDR